MWVMPLFMTVQLLPVIEEQNVKCHWYIMQLQPQFVKFLKFTIFSWILKIKFAVMNYSKKLEIFLANLQIKLDRIERPHCIASKANITAL